MVPNMWCWMILTGETMISGWCFYPWTGDGFSSMNPHRLTKVFHSHSSQIHCHSFPLPSNPSMLKFPHWWTIWDELSYPFMVMLGIYQLFSHYSPIENPKIYPGSKTVAIRSTQWQPTWEHSSGCSAISAYGRGATSTWHRRSSRAFCICEYIYIYVIHVYIYI